MAEKIKNFILIATLSLLPTFLIWLPFFLRLHSFWGIPLPQSGLATIVANYDGPLYLVVAKTFYNKAQISANYQFPLPTEYYTSHFPLFPLLIRLVGIVTNYPYSMLVVTLLSSILSLYFFHKLISQFADKKNALFLTLLFAVFPARWLVVRSVGSPDPLFIAACMASLYYFKSKKYMWAGIWGALAQITKSPGIILLISFVILIGLEYSKIQKIDLKKYLPILLIPLSLLLVFTTYYFTQYNFWAYFNSGDNIHLFFPPFQIFNYSAPWVGTFWLEEIIFIYMIGAVGTYRLFAKREIEYAVFTGIFFVLTLFVAHRDLMRYSLPIVPFLFVAFSDFLTRKESKIAFALIAIPIYLFSLAFISQNIMPISNWAPFL